MSDTGLPLSLPLMPLDGMRTPEPETIYNAAMAIINSSVAAFSAWTPTWTNLTIGNGTVTAKYKQVGKLVFCRLSIVFGTTTSISGDVRFTLPVTRAAYGGSDNITSLGQSVCYDVSAGTVFDGNVTNYSTTTASLRVFNSAGTYLSSTPLSSIVPFTWANTDQLVCEFWYEAA